MIGKIASNALRGSRQKVRPPRKACPFCFEGDHISGRNHIPHITVDVCQVHHAWLTEERLTAGADMKRQPNSVASIEMALRSLAVTTRAIAWAVDRLSEALEYCAEILKRARR